MRTEEDSDIEKRLLLAILLSMAILFVTPYIYEQIFPSPEVVETTQEEMPGESESASATNESPSPSEFEEEVEPEEPVDAQPTPGSPELAPTQGEERLIEVENDDLLLLFDTRGGMVSSARLKEYFSEDGEPLELVPQVLPEAHLRPLAFYVSDEAINERLQNAVYEVVGVAAGSLQAPVELVFRYSDGEIEAVKKIRIPESGYALAVEVGLSRLGRSLPVSVALGTGIGRMAEGDNTDFQYPSVAYYQAGSVERYYEDDLEGETVQLELTPRWAALDSKYFAHVILQPSGIRQLRMARREWLGGEAMEETEPLPLVQGVVGVSSAREFTYFVGPKKDEILIRSDQTLESLIDYGWFGILVKPLLVALKGIHSYVGNYGWSIILLTFLINLALFPVRYKQISSMQKMSELQPKMKSIQDKYKRMKRDDPRKQQMNSEIMALYKEHGVNPLGGCLPLVIQMPILFAFYRMLEASIELRGAPFMLWIQDLSAPDPYLVTPIVMGLTMVAQQKMTPATGDPSQRRMMMFLPIIFTFFFLGVSSGLAIYFLFSNLFAMMFQFGLQKLKPELAKKGGSKKSGKKKS